MSSPGVQSVTSKQHRQRDASRYISYGVLIRTLEEDACRATPAEKWQKDVAQVFWRRWKALEVEMDVEAHLKLGGRGLHHAPSASRAIGLAPEEADNLPHKATQTQETIVSLLGPALRGDAGLIAVEGAASSPSLLSKRRGAKKPPCPRRSHRR